MVYVGDLHSNSNTHQLPDVLHGFENGGLDALVGFTMCFGE